MILCVGDYFDDNFVFGKVTRISPEGPTMVFVPDKVDVRAGGCGLVAANLRSLGTTVCSVPVSRSTKYRFIDGHIPLFRVDQEKEKTVVEDLAIFIEEVEDCIKSFGKIQAVVVSDYDKGGMTPDKVSYLFDFGVPIFVDSKSKDIEKKYKGAFCVFPNEHEHPNLDEKFFSHVVRKLGEKGCNVDGVHVSTKPQQVFDVCGAGDVFMAAFIHNLMNSLESGLIVDLADGMFLTAAKFANRAAGISVRFVGTHVVSIEDVCAEEELCESTTRES